jgi:plastocyanin
MPTVSATRLAVAVVAVAVLAGPRIGLVMAQDVAKAAPQTHAIEISQFKFQPDPLRIRRGDTVSFTNKDVTPHTATATSKAWDSATLVNGKSWSLKLDEPGEIDYFCRFHPNMKAKLIVE